MNISRRIFGTETCRNLGDGFAKAGDDWEIRDIILYKPTWGFPKMGVPPNHPFLDGIFHYKESILE